MWVPVPIGAGAHRAQNISDSLNGVQAGVTFPIWVLGTEPRPPRRAASAFNHQVTPLTS